MMCSTIYISLVAGLLIGLTTVQVSAISWKRKPTDQSVAKGGTVKFHCEVNDRQGKLVIWNKGSTTLSSNGNLQIQFQDRYRIDGEFNLVITNVQESDNDQFMCNVFDLGTAPAKLTVLLPPGPPIIKRNRTGNPYKENQVVAFTCESGGGNPNPTIKWYKNGIELSKVTDVPSATIGGFSTSETVVTLDSSDHQANYTCVVFNEANKDSPLSRFILLQVQYSPDLTFAPYNPYNVMLGENAKLECNVDANPQVNSVQWLKNGQPYPNRNKVLQFNGVLKTDSGNYTCKASNGIGSPKEATASFQAVYKPIITVPGSKTYNEFEKVEIDCQVDAYPQPYQVQWEKLDNQGTVYRSTKLVIARATREHAGNYSCKAWSELRVTGQSKKQVVGQGYTYVHIKYGPGEAFISPVSNVEVGKPFVIKCSARPDGYPTASYRWEKDGQQLPQTSGTYSVTSASLQDNGVYTCTPYNSVTDGRSKKININVNEIPKFIREPAMEITIPIGHEEMLTIPCKARGRPPPIIQWYKDDDVEPVTVVQSDFYSLESKDVTVDTYSTEVTNTLLFRGPGRDMLKNQATKLRIEDMGKYHCRVKSSFYTQPISASQTINLNFKPVVSQDEVRIAVNFTLPVELPCTAQAFPVPEFQWYRKRTLITGTESRYNIEMKQVDGVSKYRSSLTITDITNDDLGFYTCFVKNILGNVSQTVHLSVKTAPESPLNLHSTQQTWESVHLKWEGGFDGGYPQHYIVKVSSPGEDVYVDVIPPTATAYNVTALRPKTSYSFVVFGKNKLGNGQQSRQLIVQTPELSIPSLGPSVEYNAETGEITLEKSIEDNYCLRVTVKYKPSASWEVAYQCLYFTELIGTTRELNLAAMNISMCLKDRPDVCGTPVQASIREAGGATLTERDVYIIASVCGVIIITLLIILIVFICKRRKNQAKYAEDKNAGRQTQPINGIQQPKKQQVYDNQGMSRIPGVDLDDPVPPAGIYSLSYPDSSSSNHTNLSNCHVTRVDYNNRQGADIHFHGVPKSPSKDKYIDLEEKKDGSLQSNPESGYSTPDPAKPKKVIYEVVV